MLLHIPHCTRRDFFETLQQCVDLGFDREDVESVAAMCDKSPDNLLSWPLDFIKHIKRRKEWLIDSQLVAASYLFELVFDLCLDVQTNVSQNPGFEKYLQISNTGGN